MKLKFPICSTWTMSHQNYFKISIIILLISTSSNSAPANPDLTLNYELGKNYIYDYETLSITSLGGTTNEDSRVSLKGQAILTPTRRDDFVLTLGQFTVELQNSNEKANSDIGILQSTASRFTVENGAIRHFYLSEDLSPWIGNIHRAIASHFSNYAIKDKQAFQSFYYETDASGKNCPSEYEIAEDGTFTRKRDLNKCEKRDGGWTVQYGVPFSAKGILGDEFSSDTSIRSNQIFKQKFNDGILTSAESIEHHKVTLLATGQDTGGKAEITTHLKFNSKSIARTVSSNPSKLSSISFDHDGTDMKVNDENTQKTLLENVLEKLCNSLGSNGRLSANTASKFLALKARIRLASKNVLQNVYNELKSGKFCQGKEPIIKERLISYFQEAAAIAGSTEAIAFMAELIQIETIPQNIQKMFQLYSIFAQKPSDSALESLTRLLQSNENIDPKYLLTASGTAHQYCLRNKGQCKENPSYKVLVDEIARKTRSNCENNGKSNAAIAGLQALGNLDALTSNAVNAIRLCLTKANRIKVHALQSFRRDPCEASLREEARKIFKEGSNPAHVRISAYLAMAQCYDQKDSDAIRSTLRRETSVQLLGFIKKHRENAWANCQFEADIDAGLFDNVHSSFLRNDPRKFSSTWSIPGIESYQSNVIFSDDSFLPKIIYGNSSFSLFGQEFNGLEVGYHLGGSEQDALERLYGPKGYYPEAYQFQQKHRSKRQTVPTLDQNELNALQAQTKVDKRIVEPSDLYFRVFGTTIFSDTIDFTDSFSSSTSHSIRKKIQQFLQGESVDYSGSYPLYGDELIVPTASGLSLWIHNEGAAIASIIAHQSDSGKSSRTFNFSPGLSVANKMKMSIGGEILESGLKVITKASASTNIKASISVTNGKIDLKINLPKTNVKLVEISNELYWFRKTNLGLSKFKKEITTVNDPSCTIDKCTKYLPILTGVKICIKAEGAPKSNRNIPHFPLSGPASYKIELSPPQGASDLTFQITYPSKRSEKTDEREFVATFDAPGSRDNYKASLRLNVKRDDDGLCKFSAQLESAKYTTGILLEKTKSDATTDVVLKVNLDSKTWEAHYTKKTGRDINGDSTTHTLSYKIPISSDVILAKFHDVKSKSGSERSYRSWNYIFYKVSPNFSSSEQALEFTGAVDVTTGKRFISKISNLQLNYRGSQIFLVNGNILSTGENTFTFDLDTKFQVFNEQKDGRIKGVLDKTYPSISLKGQLRSNSNPQLNSQIDLSREASLKNQKISIKIISENGLRIIDNVNLVLNEKFHISESWDLNLPSYGIASKFSYLVEDDPSSLMIKASGMPIKSSSVNIPFAEFNLGIDKSKTNHDLSSTVTCGSGEKYFLKSSMSNTKEHLMLHQSFGQDSRSYFSVDTEVFDSSDSQSLWKNIRTKIGGSFTVEPIDATAKYELDPTTRKSRLTVSGLGTARIDFSGAGKNGYFSVTSFRDSNSRNIHGEVSIVGFYKGFANLKKGKGTLELEASSKVRNDAEKLLKSSLHFNDGKNENENSANFLFDLKLNGPNDPSNEISLDKNVRINKNYPNTKISSRSTLVIFGKKRSIHINLFNEDSNPKKYSVNLEYVNSDAETLEISSVLLTEMTRTTSLLTWTNKIIHPNHKYKGTLKFGVVDKNTEMGTGKLLLSYQYAIGSEPVNINDVELEQLVIDGERQITFSINGFGRILPSPIQYKAIAILGGHGKYSFRIIGGHAGRETGLHFVEIILNHLYSTNYKSITLEGSFDLDYNDKVGAANTGKLELQYKFYNVKNFEILTSGNLELKNSVNIKSKYSATNLIKVSPGEFRLERKRTASGPGGYKTSTSLQIVAQDTPESLNFVFELKDNPLLSKIFEGDSLNVKFDTTKDIENLRTSITGTVPTSSSQEFSLVLKHISKKQLSIIGKFGRQEFNFGTEMNEFRNGKDVSINLSINRTPLLKLTVNYELTGDKRSAEATFKWKDNSEIKSSGTLMVAGNDNKAVFEFTIPEKNQKWMLEIARQSLDRTKSLTFSASSTQPKQFVTGTIKRSTGSAHSTWSGKLKSDFEGSLSKFDFDGMLNIHLSGKYFDESQMPGSSVLVEGSYAIGEYQETRSIFIDAGNSDRKKKLNAKVCLSKEDCYEWNSIGKMDELEIGLDIKLKTTQGSIGSFSARNFVSEDRKTRSTSFDTSFIVPSKRISFQIGLNMYKKPGISSDVNLVISDVSSTPSEIQTRGIEIILADRTIGAQVACADWNNADATASQVTVWSDKKNYPNRNGALAYSVVRASINEQGQGKNINLVAHHHKLQRDLQVRSKYRYGITSKVLQAELELDIFKRAEDKLMYNIDLEHNVESESYALNYELKSNGQRIVNQILCDSIKIDYPNYSANCVNKWNVIGQPPFESRLNYAFGPSHEIIKIDINGKEYFNYKTTYNIDAEQTNSISSRDETSSTITELKIVLQLPGMTDQRLINIRLSKNPFRFTLETNPSSSRTTTVIWLGRTSVIGGGFGISRVNQDGSKQRLIDFDTSLKSKQLEIDFSWNKENIASYLDYVIQRGGEVGIRASETCTYYHNIREKLRQSFTESLQRSSQDLEPLLQWWESRLAIYLPPQKLPRWNLFKYRPSSPNCLIAKALIDGSNGLKTVASSLNPFLDSIAAKSNLPSDENIKNCVTFTRKLVEKSIEKFNELTAFRKPILKLIVKILKKEIVKVVHTSYNALKVDLNEMLPYSEVRKFLEHFNDYIELAMLEPGKVTEANRTEILDEFQQAQQKILHSIYSVKYNEGIVSARIPMLHKTLTKMIKQSSPISESDCIEKIAKNPGSALPPVNATAFLIGDSTYITFDGTEGRIQRACRYLLTSDVTNRNFSVAIEMNDPSRIKAATIFITDGENTVGIRLSGGIVPQVSVNGKLINIYSESTHGNFIVYADGSFAIVEGNMGVTVGCGLRPKFCAVQVSGFYHGKLRGIFGNFNNEPSDDWTLPNGKVTTQDGIFQRSWKLNTECHGNTIWKDHYTVSMIKSKLDKNVDSFFTRSSTSPHRDFSTDGYMMMSYSRSNVPSFKCLLMSFILLILFKIFNN